MYYFSKEMARQKGLFKIIGTLDDINFYVIGGIGYARKAGGGFNGYAIKTKESMQRVRENGSEFGHCSRIKKQFRLALLTFLKDIKGKDFHTRLMQLFLELKALDALSERGKRTVTNGLQTTKGKLILSQYIFTPNNTILNRLYNRASFDWVSQTLNIVDFNPSGYKAPKTATHLGITLGVLDFDFDATESGPTASLQVSPHYFLPIGSGASSFELVPNAVIAPEHIGIAVLSLQYYEIIESKVYNLETSLGVQIMACL